MTDPAYIAATETFTELVKQVAKHTIDVVGPGGAVVDAPDDDELSALRAMFVAKFAATVIDLIDHDTK